MSQASPITISGSENPGSQATIFNSHGMDGSPVNPIDYARIMHEHTKRQLDTATSSARRRSQGLASSPESPTSSVSSIGS